MLRQARSFTIPLALATLLLAGLGQAWAAPEQIRILPQRDLRFGSFAVMGSGYREISPTGAIIESGIFPTGVGDTGPAQFTISYDRGSNTQRPLNLQIQLVFSPPPTVQIGGVTTQLSALRSDLPGGQQIVPGQIVTVTIPDCRTRVCEKTFHLGGRLDVNRTAGGASIIVPIPVDVTLVSAK